MKARLLKYNDKLELLTCTGRISFVSNLQARQFLFHFDNPDYYTGPGSWDYPEITMEDYHGETIAYVNANAELCVSNPELYRKLMTSSVAVMLTISQYAQLHNVSDSLIRRLCRTERLPGAVQKGGTWLIPEDAPYPADRRYKRI